MSFFKFNDDKSKQQAAVALVYLIDTKKQNATNVARYYTAKSRGTESRVDFDIAGFSDHRV